MSRIDRLKEFSIILSLSQSFKWQANMSNFPKTNIPNDELINGIRSGSPEIFKHLKLSCFPFVLKYVRSTNGMLKDAEEIFQDALIVVFKKLKRSELQLNCQFTTYFISICKYIWTFKQDKGNNFIEVNVEHFDHISDEKEIEDLYLESKEFQLYRHYFNKLKKRQQKILTAAISGKSYNELYMDFGFKNVDVFKNEVYRIKQRLIKQISSDESFKKLNGNTNWSL